MKTNRYIIYISFLLVTLSLIVIYFIESNGKLYDILIGIMTGALISFLLEIPNYTKLRKDNFNLLFHSLYNLKFHLESFNNIMKKNLKNNEIVTAKFYEQNIQLISNDINLLKNFDVDYFLNKEKRCLSTFIINDIDYKFNILMQYTTTYSIEFNKKQIQFLELNQSKEITANVMKNEIEAISDLCNSYSEYIDKNVKELFRKKDYNIWMQIIEKINNVKYTFNNTK